MQSGPRGGVRRMHLAELLGYRRRWQLLSLFFPRPISSSAPIVVGGCHRSGTTLLRVLLGRHPKIAAGAESTVFLKRISSPSEIGALFDMDPGVIARWQRQSRTQVEFIDRFQAAVLASEGKEIWAEKTPGNVLRFGFVRRHFPNAWLIHIVRDGRDVVCSMRRQRWPKPCGKQGSAAELRRCADYWARYVTSGRRFADDPRYFELHYEDLVRNPEQVLRELLDFIGLEGSDELLAVKNPGPGDNETRELAAVDTAALGTWRDELLPVEKQIVCGAIGDLLIELGYESDLTWGGARSTTERASPHFAKRWTRAERIWIELIALWRTVRDPRHPLWPRLTSAALATIYLASPIDPMLHRIPLVGALADLLVLAAAVALAGMLAPALLRAKRRAIKRARAAREGLSYPIFRPPPRPA
jgi:protein-tyrosine sulfotransferase